MCISLRPTMDSACFTNETQPACVSLEISKDIPVVHQDLI